MSYQGIGQAPPPASPDTAPYDALAPLTTSRGFVQVPTYDVRQYVQTTLTVLAVGFGIGVGVGAIFGNILRNEKLSGSVGKVFRNRRTSRRPKKNAGKRRTSARRRGRGRPSARPVEHDELTLRVEGRSERVTIHGGRVEAQGKAWGTVYDMGTSFRAVPRRGGEVRDFGTLAGAAKHVLRFGDAMTPNAKAKRPAKYRAGEVIVVRETWEPGDMSFGMPSVHQETSRKRFRSPEEAAKVLGTKGLEVSAVDGSWYAKESRALAGGGAVISRFYVNFPPSARKTILKRVRALSPDLIVSRATRPN